MFFDNWSGILRVLIVGALAYFMLILLLRVSGKRTLSKMNAFDFIITVALGSTLATILLSNNVALAEGVTALALLIGLQYMITWLSVRSQLVRRLIKAEPTLLFYQGDFMEKAMIHQRVTQEEVYAAVRAQGHTTLDVVNAVVLETDGTMTVLSGNQPQQGTTLKTVGNFDRISEAYNVTSTSD